MNDYNRANIREEMKAEASDLDEKRRALVAELGTVLYETMKGDAA